MGLAVPTPSAGTVAALCWTLLLAVATALPQARPEDADSQGDSSVTYYIYPTPGMTDMPYLDDSDTLVEGEPLTMVFHGFKGNHMTRSMHAIKEALLVSGVSNVVVVDWSVLADASNSSALTAYHHVRDHGVAKAATLAAQWIQSALDKKNIHPSRVHLIGFSLGAHVTGIIGQTLNSSIGRISGLDPPKFGYEKAAKYICLDRSDAMFVNAIHTSGGILSYTETDPIGHVDFFPNGDTLPQKGCPYENPIDIITCSHYMAFALFSESILHKNALIGTACDNWQSFNQGHCDNGTHAPMGYSTPDTTRGKFFMKTKSAPPYGEDEPDNPLPDSIKSLLIYDTSEAFIQPQDVVSFIKHQAQHDGTVGAEPPEDESSAVMKVKGGSRTTTTPDPPSFLSSGGSSMWTEALTFLVTSFAGYNLLQLVLDWWTS